MWTAIELYTWILGNTLVGVSVAYNPATSLPNALSGRVLGLKVSPLGYTIHITMHKDMPIIRESANLMNS